MGHFLWYARIPPTYDFIYRAVASLSLPPPSWPTTTVTVNMYTGEALQKRWYQMLGNHDYQGNVSFHLHHLRLRSHKLANAEC